VIVEALMEGHPNLGAAFESVKASYLEEAITALVSTAIPSEAIYRGAAWDDPDTGQVWENDVVAVAGNFVSIFEAKSGRIKDAWRHAKPAKELQRTVRRTWRAIGSATELSRHATAERAATAQGYWRAD
jgi:hypothetical protein